MDICHLQTSNVMVPLNERHFLDIDRDTKEEAIYQFDIQLEELLEAQEVQSGGEIVWEVPNFGPEEVPDLTGFPSLDSDLEV
ncbi:hypothetical protein D3C73_1444550 [compost metagenome]